MLAGGAESPADRKELTVAMSEFAANRPAPLRLPVQLGGRAAAALVAELARHHGPKSGLLIGAGAGSPVLAAAIDRSTRCNPRTP
jgi:hypothetical protein